MSEDLDFRPKNRIRDYLNKLNLPPTREEEWLKFALDSLTQEIGPFLRRLHRSQVSRLHEEVQMEQDRDAELWKESMFELRTEIYRRAKLSTAARIIREKDRDESE